MAREFIEPQTGKTYYDPGSGLLTEFVPGGGLTPLGIWLPFSLDSVGNLLVSDGPIERSITSATLTRVASSITSVQVLAANPNRSGALFYNNSSQICYLAFAASASATLFTEYLEPGSTYSLDLPIYPGIISAVWKSANGYLQVTEF